MNTYFKNENFHYNCLGKTRLYSTDLATGTLGHRLEEDAREYVRSVENSSQCVTLEGKDKELVIQQALKNVENKENRHKIRRGRS